MQHKISLIIKKVNSFTNLQLSSAQKHKTKKDWTGMQESHIGQKSGQLFCTFLYFSVLFCNDNSTHSSYMSFLKTISVQRYDLWLVILRPALTNFSCGGPSLPMACAPVGIFVVLLGHHFWVCQSMWQPWILIQSFWFCTEINKEHCRDRIVTCDLISFLQLSKTL